MGEGQLQQQANEEGGAGDQARLLGADGEQSLRHAGCGGSGHRQVGGHDDEMEKQVHCGGTAPGARTRLWYRPGISLTNLYPGAPVPSALPVSRAFVAALVLTIAAGPSAAGELPVERLSAPPGFAIELYAAGLPDARSLALGEEGTVFVGTRRAGQVYALPDRDRDGRPDRVVRLLSGLNMPNGVALREGALYVAEVGRI